MQTNPGKRIEAAPTGGLVVAWLLGDDPKTIRTRDGQEKTIIELRDPRRLSNSIVIWLEGAAGDLSRVQPGAVIQLHVESVRSGRARGELVASVSREAVETAFARAAEVQR
ncbi:MAG TPA: hypothetical protein VFR97_02505 [Capillimicrobium sp.]|nr:hypothetical protein [Capillimicrobium sp.]